MVALMHRLSECVSCGKPVRPTALLCSYCGRPAKKQFRHTDQGPNARAPAPLGPRQMPAEPMRSVTSRIVELVTFVVLAVVSTAIVLTLTEMLYREFAAAP